MADVTIENVDVFVGEFGLRLGRQGVTVTPERATTTLLNMLDWMISSGDFSNQAETPQPFDIEELKRHAAEGAVNDMEMSGIAWAQIPGTLAEFGLDIMVHQLIELGHGDMPVKNLGVLLGLIHEDGSWV